MVKLIAEGLQAGVARRFARLGAPSQEIPCRSDEFLPPSKHLFQQARPTRHGIVNQQIQLVVGLLHDQKLKIIRPHVEQACCSCPKSFSDVDPLAFVGNRMKLEHVHFGLNRHGQPSHITSAPFLVNLQEIGDFGWDRIGRLRRPAYRADPVAEFALLHPPSLAKVHQLNALSSEVADLLIADLECLAASISLAEPTKYRNRH